MSLAGFTHGNVILLLPREPASPLQFQPVGSPQLLAQHLVCVGRHSQGLLESRLPALPDFPPPQAGTAAGSAGEHMRIFLQNVHYSYSQKRCCPAPQ